MILYMVNLLNPKELFLFLEDYETSSIEKKQRGVVFTNLKVVEEVMKEIPKEISNELWKTLNWISKLIILATS